MIFRKHLINIGAEADFIKIFVLNSHKDKGGKKTASRTTRLPRLFIMIRLSKVRRICCYKTIFSYISFIFSMASPSSPAIVDVTCDCIFVSFIIRIKFVF